MSAADVMELGPDSEPVTDKRKGFIERYIHGEIYRVRPEVMVVVHSHSPSVIPFGVTRTKLRPIYHMGSFLWSGAPVWDIRKVREENDLLVRAHGMTVVGATVPEAVFRAIYTEMNARLQLQATQLEGPIEFLSDEEGRRSTAANAGTLERPWELWKKAALGPPGR